MQKSTPRLNKVPSLSSLPYADVLHINSRRDLKLQRAELLFIPDQSFHEVDIYSWYIWNQMTCISQY